MITKEDVLRMHGDGYLYHMSKTDAQEKPLKVRLNGQCQTWKTRPEEFRQPVKYGIYDYFNVTNENANEWRTMADV